MDRFILVMPMSHRFLSLARQAVRALIDEAGAGTGMVFDLQLAVTEACNLINHAYMDQGQLKVVSLTGVFENGSASITLDDGAVGSAGRKVRQKITRRQLSPEGALALKVARQSCDQLVLSSGITGGVRIQLVKALGD